MEKERAWCNAWFLLSWRPLLVAFLGYALGGWWPLALVVLSDRLTQLLKNNMGQSDVYPLVAPVKKHSLRWFYYEGIIHGYVFFGFFWLALVLFVIDFKTLPFYTSVGLWISTLFVCSFGLNCGHELVHRTKTFGEIVSLLFSCGHFSYKGHVSIHHSPKTMLTQKDYIFFQNNHRPSFYSYLKKSSRRLFFFVFAYFDGNIRLPLKTSCRIFNVFFVGALFCSFCYQSMWNVLVVFSTGIVATIFDGTIFFFQHWGLDRPVINEKDAPYGDHLTWDCNFVFSNFSFLNLPRHCHHHDSPTTPYYGLKIYPQSNRLPTDYMTLMRACLRPKRFFEIMTPLVEKAKKS